MSSLKNKNPLGSSAPRNSYSRIDVETGEVSQINHAHKRPYTPGASPREILASHPQRVQTAYSPRGTRYMEGYRRRMRQASLNLPSDTQLDEDLGFPPVCSPPPEVFCGSIGDNRMRNRSKSDAHSGMLRKLSTSSNNGGGMLGGGSSGGGLLVFFPSSPSSSFGQANCPRHESSTDETIDSGTGGSVRFWSHSTETEDNEQDDISMKSVEGIASKVLKRPPDLVTSAGSPASTGAHQNQSLVGSPRGRPLYVDTTQFSNMENLKKRSPVTQVVDFVRGRNRTYSLQLSGSPFFGSSTPSSSPQSITARGSASCDTQPVVSPGRRQTVGGRFQRCFGPAMPPKSLDSGLDLTSPTINHTALLIKEASLFSSFDSMSIGTAVPDINAIFFDNHDAVYSLFMKAHKCYDLIPTSSKLVVFDTHLPVRKAFYALVYNGVRAAPLWDSDKQQFTGMLTITDFIKILCRHYDQGDANSERIRALEDQQISHWREHFEQDGSLRPFVSIDPNESLHRAVEILCESKVHRLPVLDRKSGNITYILTHKRIMKFLSLYMRDLPRPTFMSCTPRELGIGSWGDVLCCHVDTPIHDALELFLKNRVSALPLIDENGKVVDIYAKFDVISLAAENSYDKLDCTVQEALKHRSEWFEGVQTCLETDSLFSVLEAIVKAEVHRLIVTDQDKKVVGVVSLSDILKYLVLDPCQEPPQQPSTSSSTSAAAAADADAQKPTPVPSRTASATSQSDSPPSSIPEGVEIEEEDDEEEDAPSCSNNEKKTKN